MSSPDLFFPLFPPYFFGIVRAFCVCMGADAIFFLGNKHQSFWCLVGVNVWSFLEHTLIHTHTCWAFSLSRPSTPPLLTHAHTHLPSLHTHITHTYTHRQTDRQTDRQTHTHTHLPRPWCYKEDRLTQTKKGTGCSKMAESIPSTANHKTKMDAKKRYGHKKLEREKKEKTEWRQKKTWTQEAREKKRQRYAKRYDKSRPRYASRSEINNHTNNNNTNNNNNNNEIKTKNMPAEVRLIIATRRIKK